MISFPDPWPVASYTAQVHARTAYPHEAVGVVLDDGEYVPLQNVAVHTQDDFLVWDELEPYRDRIVALIHSHPFVAADLNQRDHLLTRGPSRLEWEQQIAWDIPFGLIAVTETEVEGPVYWGDSVPIAPLLGRPFIFGIYDCWSVIRDWYRQEKGLLLSDRPRDIADLDSDADVYTPYLKQWRFEPVDSDALQLGDVLLCRAGSQKVNHAALWLGDGQILHHLRGGLSSRQPFHRWRSFMPLALCVRYTDAPTTESAGMASGLDPAATTGSGSDAGL